MKELYYEIQQGIFTKSGVGDYHTLAKCTSLREASKLFNKYKYQIKDYTNFKLIIDKNYKYYVETILVSLKEEYKVVNSFIINYDNIKSIEYKLF